jgi:hypothetical protein
VFKAQGCPKTPFRRIPRSIYEEARDVARALAKTEAELINNIRPVREQAATCHVVTESIDGGQFMAGRMEFTS